MFKYGSFRLFVLKILFGALLIIISAIQIVSLLTFDHKDPGFNNFISEDSNIEVVNYFGIFGAYLSSYSLVLLGQLVYIISFFILLELL